MQLDWFTVFAQIVNFLILVYLLKRFLYRPIINAMARRENKIASRMQEAEEKSRRAQKELETFQRKSQELEDQEERLFREARAEADARRETLIGEVRKEVERTREAWQEDVEREREQFLEELARELSLGVCSVAHRTLTDLANTDLEGQVIERFLQRLRTLPQQEKQQLAHSLRDSDGVVSMKTAFEIPQSERERVVNLLEEILGQPTRVEFVRDGDLVCGIALETPAHRMEWSIAGYFGDLEREVASALGAPTAPVARRE